MPDRIIVTHHVVDHLPGGGVAMVEDAGDRIEVWLSGAHTLEEIAAALGPMFTEYMARMAMAGLRAG